MTLIQYNVFSAPGESVTQYCVCLIIGLFGNEPKQDADSIHFVCCLCVHANKGVQLQQQ